MHFGTKFIQEYTSLINELLLFLYWMVTVLPKWAGDLSPCCCEWEFGAVHRTHTCAAAGYKADQSPSPRLPRTCSSHSHCIWALTLKLQTKGGGGGLWILHSDPTLSFCIWRPPWNHSWAQFCMWLLRASQPPGWGTPASAQLTLTGKPIQSEVFLQEPMHRICIQG